MAVGTERAKPLGQTGFERRRIRLALMGVGYACFLFAAGIAPTSPITPALSTDTFTSLLGTSFQIGYLAAFFILALFAKMAGCRSNRSLILTSTGLLVAGYGLQALSPVDSNLMRIGVLGNTLSGVGFACLAFSWLALLRSKRDDGSVSPLLAGSFLAPAASSLVYAAGFVLSGMTIIAILLAFSLATAFLLSVGGAPCRFHDAQGSPESAGCPPIAGSMLRKIGIQTLCASLLVLVGPTVGFGVINAEMASDAQPVLANIGLMAAVAALCLARRVFPEKLTIQRIYLVLFPVLATMLLVLTFSGVRFAGPFLMVTYLSYNLTSLLMIIFCIEETRDENDAIATYGVMAGTVYAVSTLGAWCGSVAAAALADNMAMSVLTFAVLYVLALAVLFISRQGRRAKETPEPHPVETVDLVGARCGAVARLFGLTRREADVLDYLAHGRDVPAIADRMAVSKDTVKVHMKGIYRKLGVHTRQDLIDLIEQIEP